ncbi:MAG: hypothetical protein K2N70_08225, partial [Helicobacter sp.]|nr:hypothetical protein [Helicobacter sp.]
IIKMCLDFMLHHPLSQGSFANHPTRSGNSLWEIRTLLCHFTQTILKNLCAMRLFVCVNVCNDIALSQ